jgi:hypothetical protein
MPKTAGMQKQNFPPVGFRLLDAQIDQPTISLNTAKDLEPNYWPQENSNSLDLNNKPLSISKDKILENSSRKIHK